MAAWARSGKRCGTYHKREVKIKKKQRVFSCVFELKCGGVRDAYFLGAAGAIAMQKA
ncbi:MAG: hypothetical protein AABZ67_13860 [Pseudomonadota bacterium]